MRIFYTFVFLCLIFNFSCNRPSNIIIPLEEVDEELRELSDLIFLDFIQLMSDPRTNNEFRDKFYVSDVVSTSIHHPAGVYHQTPEIFSFLGKVKKYQLFQVLQRSTRLTAMRYKIQCENSGDMFVELRLNPNFAFGFVMRV